MAAKIVNWEEVKKKIPTKPDAWKVKDLVGFFEIYGLQNVIDTFKLNAIDGNIFLNLDDDDEIWEDLELDNSEEKLLKQYKNQLKNYNKSFNQVNSNQSALKKAAFSLKDNLKIEESQYVQHRVPPEPKQGKKLEFHSKKNKKKNPTPESSDEDKGRAKSGKKPIEKKVVDFSSSDDESKLKKSKNNEDDDEEKKDGETTITPVITLTQISKLNQMQMHNFENTFEINRNMEHKHGIFVDDPEASRKHCIIHLIEKSFLIQDIGSSNFIFIKMEENRSIVLEEGMEIKMGDSLFKVCRLASKKITIDYIVDFEDESQAKEGTLQVKFDGNEEMVFGKKVKGKKKIEFTFDSEIDDEHAIFKKYKDKYLFQPLVTVNRSWIKLGDGKNKLSDLYLLENDMEFLIGEIRFIVDKVSGGEIPPCGCKKELINAVAFPCKHPICSKSMKKNSCDKCQQKIEKKVKVRRLYRQV